MYEMLLYPGATGPTNSTATTVVAGFVGKARGTNTQSMTLQIPELYLGPSCQINATLNGAAGTATYSLSACVLNTSD